MNDVRISMFFQRLEFFTLRYFVRALNEAKLLLFITPVKLFFLHYLTSTHMPQLLHFTTALTTFSFLAFGHKKLSASGYSLCFVLNMLKAKHRQAHHIFFVIISCYFFLFTLVHGAHKGMRIWTDDLWIGSQAQ